MFLLRRAKRLRRGGNTVQTMLLLTVIPVVVIVGGKVLGATSEDHLNQTAGEVGDPARFCRPV